ncbi:3-ketoacyl-CoA thiolase [Klebsiella pneumoniae]|uniref:3-ketoacyl-CoA thiolase n=1 Tax=Klebsiella pneumoniae TaxID=573 RepID=A0A4P0YFM8_KLEPN|nr:3-ketoacyl-CoA thiolase [Klebsiella pneumoniae]
MKDVVIVGALRTPIGCFQGALSRHSAVELGSVVVKALVEKTGIDPHSVDEVILGQVLTAGTGQNPARQSAIRGGLPNTVSAITINDVCGSRPEGSAPRYPGDPVRGSGRGDCWRPGEYEPRSACAYRTAAPAPSWATAS